MPAPGRSFFTHALGVHDDGSGAALHAGGNGTVAAGMGQWNGQMEWRELDVAGIVLE